MASEPNKPIEDLLKASAQARRAEFGADQPMPNPMRARLHEEIARGSREEERPARGFSSWFPRLVISAAAAALLISAPIVWLRRNAPSRPETMQLAAREPAANAPVLFDSRQRESAGTKQSGLALAKTVAIPGAAKADEASSIASADQAASQIASPPNTFAEAAAPPPVEERTKVAVAEEAKASNEAGAAKKSDNTLEKFTDVTIASPSLGGGNLSSNARFSKGVVTPKAPAAALAPAPAQKTESRNFRQQFAQNARNQPQLFASGLKQNVAVLTNFQMEQTGSKVRFVDADGSTYSGEIEQISQKDSRALANQKPQSSYSVQAGLKQRDKEMEAGASEFYFRARGYSNSLRRPVVVEGNYLTSPTPETSRPAEARENKQPEQTPARIVGTAKISGENPVEVDAVSVAQ